MKNQIEPPVPCNYFGKGADYQLPEDIQSIREFEDLFDKWVTENPDDPTGEKTIELWKSQIKAQTPPVSKQSEIQATPKLLPEVVPINLTASAQGFQVIDGIAYPIAPLSEQPLFSPVDDEGDEIRLKLTTHAVKLLKAYATFRKRRPRDIVMSWILTYAKITPTL